MLRILVLSLVFFLSTTHIWSQKLTYVQGELLVKMESGTSAKQSLLGKYAITSRAADNSARSIAADPFNIWLLKFDYTRYSEEEVINHLYDQPHVLYAQKNHLTEKRTTPNDEFFSRQWQYINDGSDGGVAGADMDMDLAWDITTGGITADGDTIVVCIIDDGANLNHPDLKDNIWVNRHEIPGNKIDDDNNGYVDDYHGWNAYKGTDVVDEDASHGTPVAGIIGAKGNNEIGVAGINWDVQLMIVVGGTPESSAIASYAYAYTQRKMYNETDGKKGAFVVATNSSWGADRLFPSDAPIWCDFYNELGAVGILNCASTTNSNTHVDVDGDLPTTCPSEYLMSVTNINRRDELVTSAGYGKVSIDIGAYGAQTYTTNKNSYGNFGGTSGACPHVSGVVALLYSVDCPSFMQEVKSNPAQAALAVKDMILGGVKSLPSLQDRTVSGGKLNAYQSVLNMDNYCKEECKRPYGIYVDSIGLFDINLQSINAYSSSDLKIKYRIAGDTIWKERNVDRFPYKLDSLEACSSYEFIIASRCDDGDYTDSYIRRFETEGCCYAPRDFTVSLDMFDAIISWENVVGAENYILEYKLESDTIWISATVDGDQVTYRISDIQTCSSYDVRIQANCPITGKMSDFSTLEFSGPCGDCTEDYCDIKPKDTSDEWIETVEIKDVFINNSGNNQGKGQFLGMFDIKLKQGDTYTLEVTPGYDSGSFAEFFEVYIDFNQDIAFDSSELIYQDTAAVTSMISGDFTIPSEIPTGITRMRVIMRFSELHDSGCDEIEWGYGEYEDYCVEILNSDGCPNRLTLASAVDSTTTSLEFALSMSSTISDYQVQYKKSFETEYRDATITGNKVSITGLDKCTTYDIRYSGTCATGGTVDEADIQLKTSCTSSTSNNKKKEIYPYPSPSRGLLMIHNERNELIKSLEVYDIKGTLIHQENLMTKNKSINIQSSGMIARGVYFLKIHAYDGIYQRKWVKL